MTESPWLHLMQENQVLAHKLEALEKQFKVDKSASRDAELRYDNT
jgi:hypothetical protein